MQHCPCPGVFREARGSRASLPGEAGARLELHFLGEVTLPVPWHQPALLGLEALEVQLALLSDALASPADSPGALGIPRHQHLLVHKSPGTC